ncbi:MAG: SBBP repeat-containing protein [Bacteroidota bacterium]
MPLFLNKFYFKFSFLMLVFVCSTFHATTIKPTESNNTQDFLNKVPVLFTENKGQLTDFDGKPVPFVLYTVQAPGVNLYVTEQGLTYTLVKNSIKEDDAKTEWNRFDMTLKGATIKKENIITENKSNHFSQYFLGHCKDGITDVYSYEKVIIKNIYPHIDWVLYNSNNKGFKYDFVVHPGGDPEKIKMAYVSKKPIDINEQGELEISNTLGNLSEKKPVSFLDQKEIKTRFVQTQNKNIKLNNDDGYESTISFDFPHSRVNRLTSDLTIDPQLVWGTFFGGYNSEYPTSVTTDLSGNFYVTGSTNSVNFPTQTGPYFQGTLPGGQTDFFISKFNINGNLLWSTYYGGNSGDNANSITTDSNGNIFITGTTGSSNFPLLNAGTYFQGVINNFSEVFILKFNNAGNRLWATLYGGEFDDMAFSIKADLNGNVFVTGYTNSPGFPVLNAGTYFQTIGAATMDAFILKFDNAGNRLWATFYGGAQGDEWGMSITTDISGNVFLTGFTESADMPLLNSGGTAYSQAFTGGIFQSDAFISKFSNNGTLLWGTYYGDTNQEVGYSIVTDQSGNVFVAGRTHSLNFPIFNPGANSYFQGNIGGASDAFILKFDNNGTRLWATFYGGTSTELNFGVYTFENMLAIDGCGNLYCGFDTQSSDIITKANCNGGYRDTTLNGVYDYFITKFANSGQQLWASYLGGDGDDRGAHIAVDASNNLYLAGACSGLMNNTSYPLMPTWSSYYDGTHAGLSDVYISKFTPILPTYNVTQSNPLSCQCNGSANVSVVGCPPFNYYWSNGTSLLNSTLTTSSINNLCPGIYDVTVTSNCNTYIASVNLVNTQTLVATISASDSIRCNPSTVSLTGASGASTYSWSGPGIVSTTSAPSVSVNLPGTYSLTVTDANGCSASSTIAVYQSSNTADILTNSTGTITCSHPTIDIASYSETPLITYTWMPGSMNTNSITVTTGGNYTLYVTNPSNGCVSSSTIHIEQNTSVPLANASNNSSLTCIVTQVPIAGSGTGNYAWAGPGIMSGSNTPNPIVNAPGVYTLTVTNPANGCSSTDTTTVIQQILMPIANANSNDTLSCFINTVTIAGSGIGTYAWSGPGIVSGGNTNQPTVNEPGIYTLSVTNSQGCTATATTQVLDALDTPTIMVSPNVTIFAGEQTTLFSEGSSNFTWLPNQGISCLTCTSITVAPAVNTSYCAQTSLGSCTTQACIMVFIKELCSEDISYSVPNALSPNGDGLNDEFCLRGWEDCVNTFYIAIYDRWGEKIYESTNSGFCWDGKYKGKILEPDVFVYYIKAEMVNNSKITKKGDITLIR